MSENSANKFDCGISNGSTSNINLQLQSKINDLLKSDPRKKGIDVSAHYKNYIDTSVLVFDLHSILGPNSRADVFGLFLQFAEKMKSEHFSTVELAYNGETRFMIEGDCFQKLGGRFRKREFSLYNTNLFQKSYESRWIKTISRMDRWTTCSYRKANARFQ